MWKEILAKLEHYAVYSVVVLGVSVNTLINLFCVVGTALEGTEYGLCKEKGPIVKLFGFKFTS